MAPRRGAKRRAQILGELESIFLREGFRQLTVGALATRLRCSRSTLYAIATTKEALFLLVEDHILRRIGREARRRAKACEDPGDRVAAFLEGTVSSLLPVGEAFLDDIFHYTPARQLFDQHQRGAIETLRQLIEAGIAAGALQGVDPLIAAEALDAAVQRIRNPKLLREAGLSPSEAFGEVSQLLRHGLLRETPRRRR
jgi:AcrR family transcriptional regulator